MVLRFTASKSNDRTTPSNSIGCPRLVRCHVLPRSELRITPWLAVATNIVLFTFHLDLFQRPTASTPTAGLQHPRQHVVVFILVKKAMFQCTAHMQNNH